MLIGVVFLIYYLDEEIFGRNISTPKTDPELIT